MNNNKILILACSLAFSTASAANYPAMRSQWIASNSPQPTIKKMTQAMPMTNRMTSNNEDMREMGKMDTNNMMMPSIPQGVANAHLIMPGKAMISIKRMQMHMQGLQQGTNSTSAKQITSVPSMPMTSMSMPQMGAMMSTPSSTRIAEEMDMSMNMVGIMYGVSDNVTAKAMLTHVETTMVSQAYSNDGNKIANSKVIQKTSGIGDTSIAALIKIKQSGDHKVQLNLGANIPSGDHNKNLGSGSYKFEPSITYTGGNKSLSWGMQAGASLPMNKSNEGYRAGNRIEGTTWINKKLMPSVDASARISAFKEKNSTGALAMKTMGHTIGMGMGEKDTGRDEVDLHFGVKIASKKGALVGHNIGIEVGAPIYQRVNGTQMSKDLKLSVGWSKSFY